MCINKRKIASSINNKTRSLSTTTKAPKSYIKQHMAAFCWTTINGITLIYYDFVCNVILDFRAYKHISTTLSFFHWARNLIYFFFCAKQCDIRFQLSHFFSNLSNPCSFLLVILLEYMDVALPHENCSTSNFEITEKLFNVLKQQQQFFSRIYFVLTTLYAISYASVLN